MQQMSSKMNSKENGDQTPLGEGDLGNRAQRRAAKRKGKKDSGSVRGFG